MVIIGAGPSGMTAAIYAARRKIKFLILSMDIGGQMNWSSEVDNYPGIPDITGIEIVKKFNEHLKDYNIKVKNEEVLDIKQKGKILIVKTKKTTYETKTIIIGSGKKPKKLNISGEDNLLGKGVSYCATCDAPLYKDKIVAIIGAGNSGLEAALHLAQYAKKIYLIDSLEKIAGEPYLKDRVLQNKKISFIGGAKIKEIIGKQTVEALKYESKAEQTNLPVQGIFIETGLIAKVDFANLVKKNKWGEIMIFRSTKTHEENMTNIPGIFAAGDVTDIPSKQIVVAAGEGCKAALAAFDYINKFK
ncbi:MAG: FAD-dependent oxidoreductase [Nanoarchaeota archaeon]|nr:FAD-dependent oxidoreductase [Nanoarchaeota archaeon]MBU1027588.1 FAD-dependent oxidoreductase [Nanoarchaeota archaeon]